MAVEGIHALFTGFRDKGSLFENYIFLKIKHKRPVCVYQAGVEIDFFTQDKILIKSKYNQTVSPRQLKLFKTFNAKKKFAIENINDLGRLEVVSD